MDSTASKIRQEARQVGLDITGPYIGGRYCIFEMASGDLLSPTEGLPLAEVKAEIAKHQGIPRLADMRRRRWIG